MEIPGTESEENPTGKMVRVHWKQDDFGALCIAGYSAEIPVTPSVEPIAALAANSSRNFSGRGGPRRGFVIDSNE